MNATLVYADYPPFNSSHYRIFTPAKYLKQAGHTIRVVHADQVTEVDDVVLVERNLNENDLLKYKALGAKRIIYTFDDAYRVIPANTASTNYWRGENQNVLDLAPVIRQIYKTIVPCELLAKHYNATVVPNFHDPDWVVDKTNIYDGKISIGWGGSSGHYVTWQNSCFVQALEMICMEFDNVSVSIVGGFNPNYDFVKSYINWLEFNTWKHRVATFDIGIAPLHGSYDKYRSNLKVVEYGLSGVPFVATRYIEYESSDGGLHVENTSKAWYRALRSLVVSEELRNHLGRNGRKWAKKYLFGDDALKIYEDLLWG